MIGNRLVLMGRVNLASLTHLRQSTIYLAKKSCNEELHTLAGIMRASMCDH